MNLRTLRKERGLTLEAVAYLAGVDIATISRVERGIVTPHRATVVRMARAFGVSVKRMQSLLGEEGR